MLGAIKKIDAEFCKNYQLGDENVLEGLARINIFVGANNSGKSRLIRGLFEDLITGTGHQYKIKTQSVIEFHSAADLIVRQQNRMFSGDLKSLRDVILNHYYDSANDRKPGYFHQLSDVARFSGEKFGETAKRMLDLHEEIVNYNGELVTKSIKVYIPMLRGLKPIEKGPSSDRFSNDNDNYGLRTIKDYFPRWTDNRARKTIETGLNFYNEAKRLLLGDSIGRNLIRDFEKFISETFFSGVELNIVPRLDDDVVHLKIGDAERPIYNYGDGIQSIILLTYPLFFNKEKRGFIFIEEPETHLHPGFQRIFLETLQRKEFSNFQFFITTHSNHFLDMTLENPDISVYSLHGDNKESSQNFFVQNVSSRDNRVLEMLGVRASSVFLSNCTIWVEGITDRLYIRKYLEVYQKEKTVKFVEDLHYSFVEFGGNNITHWSFLDSEDEHPNINVDHLCSKLFLITDRDSEKAKKNGDPAKKEIRKQQLQERLGDRFYCLKVREIENLLLPKILGATLSTIVPKAEKVDFHEDTVKKYSNTLIGKFIKDNFPQYSGLFDKKYLRLNDKTKFCKVAISKIEKLEDLSNEALELCEKLYKFISDNNQ